MMKNKSHNVSGDIELVWKASVLGTEPPVPKHLYGEGDMKTRAWVSPSTLIGHRLLRVFFNYSFVQVVHIQNELKYRHILVLSTDLDNIAIFCEPAYKDVRLLGNTVGVANGQVVTKKQATSNMHETLDLGAIAALLGKRQHAVFRAILCMGKTDFNWNVHNMTMDRMLKTFFWCRRNRKVINAGVILTSAKAYSQFYSMCHSKLCGNRPARARKDGNVITKADVENYLKRCQWVHEYWSGKGQLLGGPDPRDCTGYRVCFFSFSCAVLIFLRVHLFFVLHRHPAARPTISKNMVEKSGLCRPKFFFGNLIS